ncbi:LPS assembly lipoprotein LptE [Salinimicrobium sediminilitoris]|uniref:LPS assembly lipoprotein LptE n=1 Tax=Salinimicrobium sediminilitoris TaxID=2876715 RepID=UPI001E4190E8|nr:LptE family protein [Salinimicrobium sediminilitoris]MCC8359952.1 LPS assembly lipoprotein LptE [Salinimicrobium sediminilitoris]
MKKIQLLLAALFLLSFHSCGIYSFTGADVGEAETFQVNYFQNAAPIVEPGIDRTFTLQLQDLIQSQTNLNLTDENGDLVYEGEIVDYYVSPMSATAQSTAAQNRLTIVVNLRYYNTLDPEKDILDRRFSFYYDYPANDQLSGSTLATALEEIFTRITQDIFNATLTNW